MKIRPKEIPIFLNGGVSGVGRTSDNWYNDVHVHQMDAILNRLKKYGEADDYMYWLNSMLDAHSYIYGNNKDRMDRPIKDLYVEKYQRAYSGDNSYYPYLNYNNPQDRWQLQNGDNDDYNQYGIKKSFENGIFTYPGKRTSGDNPNLGYNPDGYFSGITDYRRLLGRKGDYTPELLSAFKKLLNDIGYDIYEDTNDVNRYYKLKRISNSLNGAPSETGPVMPSLVLAKDLDSFKPKLQSLNGSIQVLQRQDPESKWKIFGDRLKNAAPDILDALRLAGNLHNNNRVYDAVLKGIRPNLLQTYNTYRQVVGDEATKQAYYRRGIAGLTKAGLAFTSDADRLMAYQMEAKRAADELKAQGDLADNAEIRRTSDESNQHAWGNVQRATEVANRNLIEMNNANAAKWNLKALKYSADWTNWDNYLMGIQNRWQQKKEEDKAFLRQLATLDMQEDLLSNKTLTDLRLLRDKAYNDYITAKDGSPEKKAAELKVTELSRQLQLALIQAQRDVLGKYRILGAKSGSKLEYVRDDKYLYKTSKDIVEHFRKMSKMADDSRLKSRTKPIKLSSHPKGNTRKYLLGGVAPFTIYRPLGIGGESAISSQTGSSGTSSSSKSSGKDDAAKNKLDLVKELFKSLQGLPVDVNTAYSDIYKLFEKSKLFGEEMSTDDIAGIYLNSIRSVNLLKHSLEVFEKAKDFATSLDSLLELAVTSNGHYIALDKDGNFTEVKDLKEISEKGLSPITNQLLINMRAYSANMVGLKGDTILENVIGNGMGINKIALFIKSMASDIGTTEGKLDGISQVESGKVKDGLKILAGAPDGYYKVTTENKTQQALVNAALTYIENMLSPALKATLDAHGGTRPLIKSFLTSQLTEVLNISILPLTGKASDKDKNDNGDGNMLPSVAFFNGLGEKDTFIILDKTNDGLKINVVSTPITSKGYNTGSITFNKLESSDFGGQLLMNQATMGDSLISSTGRNNIIIDGRIYLAELPIDQEAKRNGIIKPDLRFLKNIEAADAKLREMGIDKSDPKNINTVNKVYRENNLPILYTISNNKPTITSEYARFAIVNGIGTEDAFGENPQFNDAILEVSSDKERQLFEIMMQLLGNAKYKLDNGYGIGPISWGETKLYKGTVYIPMVTSNISALAGTGFKAKGEEYNLIEARQQAADAARNKGFVPAGDASNFK